MLALSTILGGTLFLSIMEFNSNVSETAIINNMDRLAQSKMEFIVEIIKHDFNKIGYQVSPGETEIENTFSHNSIKFKTDINPNLNITEIGTIELYENSSDNKLHRVVKNSAGTQLPSESVEINGLDTRIITYFDKQGDKVEPGIGNSGEIRSMVVKIISTLDYSYKKKNKEVYRPKAYWKSEIFTKNLGR